MNFKSRIIVKHILCIAAITCLTFVPIGFEADAISAKAYVLMEQNSGRVISASNENTRLPMASTTKIMTGLLAVESGKLDNTYSVPAEALRVEGSSVGLIAGENLTLRDLVYGLMLESGNDAANAIAIILGGTSDKFVEMMNLRAKNLKLENTHFCNPSGLYNENHYTSARDLAKLAAFAMKNKDFEKIVSTKSIRIPLNGVKDGRLLKNHNDLLGSYDGAIGVKTGFVKKSGRCLVSCARRNGVELVAVTLDDPSDWKDHKQLLDSGFSQLKAYKLLSVAPEMTANVVGGTQDKVPVCYDKDTLGALKNGESGRLKLQVELDKFYYAPVKKGQKLGKMVFTADGVEIAETDITAACDIPLQGKKPIATGFIQNIWNKITSFFATVSH